MGAQAENVQRMGVAGAIGTDRGGRGRLPRPYTPGSKTGVSYEVIDSVIKDRNITVNPSDENTAMTAGNFAISSQKLRRLGGGQVVLLSPLAVNAKSSATIRATLEKEGVEFHETPYDGNRNPESLVVPTGRDRAILTAKPHDAPPITDFDHDLTYLMLANGGGPWDITFSAAKRHIERTGIGHGVLGSQSQIDQLLGNPEKLRVYLDTLKGGDFFGNLTEAQGILTALGITPSRNPHTLIDQVREHTDIRTGTFTLGPRGIIHLDEDGNQHKLRTKPLPSRKVKNPAGSGDGSASAMKFGLDNGNSVETSLVNAGKAGAKIAQVHDSLSGQLQAEDWDNSATAGRRYHVLSPSDRRRRPVSV